MYADRIVAEMLRAIVRKNHDVIQKIGEIFSSCPDGNPEAQNKMMRKAKEACGPFLLAGLLKPGKRGRYQAKLITVQGWDAKLKDPILKEDAIPDKPWLVCTDITLTSKGRHAYEQRNSFSLFVTHHALSRLAQRCGAITAGDLLIAVHNMWMAFVQEGAKFGHPRWVNDGHRLKFQLEAQTYGVAVLNNYNDNDGGVVVATIVPSE
jgi:hypothetical protein